MTTRIAPVGWLIGGVSLVTFVGYFATDARKPAGPRMTIDEEAKKHGVDRERILEERAKQLLLMKNLGIKVEDDPPSKKKPDES